jgi:hypothetical protein
MTDDGGEAVVGRNVGVNRGKEEGTEENAEAKIMKEEI